jgi:hypothetical protein
MMQSSFQGLPLLLDIFTRTQQHATNDPPVPEVLPEIQLPKRWYDFEKTLSEFKKEYLSIRYSIYKENISLKSRSRDIQELDNIKNSTESPDLRTRLESLLEDYDKVGDMEKKKENILNMKANFLAMEKVLKDTNASEFEKFRCFVCMEKYVDTFLDPCGHVLCEECLVKSNSANCPGCRAHVQSARKIFTLN